MAAVLMKSRRVKGMEFSWVGRGADRGRVAQDRQRARCLEAPLMQGPHMQTVVGTVADR